MGEFEQVSYALPQPSSRAKPRDRSILHRACVTAIACLTLTSCRHDTAPNTLRFLIESSPNNLDLRQGTDAQSERIGELIYDPLVRKDAHFVLQPALATAWDRPDPNTWVFHLRPNVHFHDGHALTSADVAYTLRSMTNGSIATSKAGAFANITTIESPDALTLAIRTSTPDNSLLFNLSDGLFGVVETGATKDEGLHPNGTGPFKFVSQTQDKEVVLERNENYWQTPPSIPRVRFEVIPDNITGALEMKKGSADVESNALTLDMVHALSSQPHIRIESGPGAAVMYANFNVADPTLRDFHVRQAIALAIDKPALIAALWRNQAVPAQTLLPPTHWAAASPSQLAQYPHDPARAIELLEQAGLHPDKQGIRLRFNLKTSTDETTRLLAQSIQQQLRAVGIKLSIRQSEFGTFFSDVSKGAFQMYILRWIGVNQDPDIFRYTASSNTFPPKGGNRGHYTNAHLDALLAQAASTTDHPTRIQLYLQIQQILATDIPFIPLWYPNNEVVHTTRLTNVHPDSSGSFDFLRTATLQ